MRRCNILYAIGLTLVSLVAASFTSCHDDSEPYPSLIADFVTAVGDAQGHVAAIVTDDGQRYTVENVIKGMEPNSTARAICEYALAEAGRVLVYKISGIAILPNVTKSDAVYTDPTGVAGVWYCGEYVNMHLLPKVYDGTHAWGFVVDSVSDNTAGGSTHFVTLCHQQRNDAEAFTGHVYLSLQPDSIAPGLGAPDSLHLAINTFDGRMTWRFALR